MKDVSYVHSTYCVLSMYTSLTSHVLNKMCWYWNNTYVAIIIIIIMYACQPAIGFLKQMTGVAILDMSCEDIWHAKT